MPRSLLNVNRILVTKITEFLFWHQQANQKSHMILCASKASKIFRNFWHLIFQNILLEPAWISKRFRSSSSQKPKSFKSFSTSQKENWNPLINAHQPEAGYLHFFYSTLFVKKSVSDSKSHIGSCAGFLFSLINDIVSHFNAPFIFEIKLFSYGIQDSNAQF